MANNLSDDVALIRRIQAVPAMLRVVCETTGLRFAAVARVTDTHWMACAVDDRLGFGLGPGDELALHTTLCDELRDSHQAIIIDHASVDPVFCNHHTPRLYRFESYISVPMFFPDGRLFGTICAFDPLPAQLRGSTAPAMVESFARLLTVMIETELQQQRTEAALLEQQAAELRDQFIAVLGHDLRNPLFAITAGTELLLRRAPDDRSRSIIEHIRASGQRASHLVADVLDFARGRLGGGLTVKLTPCPDLSAALHQVVTEIQGIYPARDVHAAIDDVDGVYCDRERVAQLVSNLLSNAMLHGAQDQPVTLTARRTDEHLLISVHNHGPEIDAAVLAQLFQPFQRRHGDRPGNGLGLGLYIAHQIALAHGGDLQVTSTTGDGTRFVFLMPLHSHG
jgi:signal transduction histidine kinase